MGSLCAVMLARVLFQGTCSNVRALYEAEIKMHTFQMLAGAGTCGWSQEIGREQKSNTKNKHSKAHCVAYGKPETEAIIT